MSGAKMTPIDTDCESSGASHEPADSADEPMVKVRPGQAAGTQLAKARVLGTLFGHDRTIRAFGRFRVLERIGAGGMGVVYEAYDPELARGVALKLINVAASDREAALAEAKALARLSHPNIVPIYDIGLADEHVYLVMELVRGKTLRRWAEGREPLEILEVYRQAGAALAAAHTVGLVHRDFKPENAIVGVDGRVRVVDFGLACRAGAPARATNEPRCAAGTPRFMAPEIEAGAAITPAADQYSFCIALGDALDLASEPAPRWIAAVLERGRAAAPSDRFESMDHLLRALVRDPARTWRRAGAVGGLAVSIGVIAFLLGRRSPSFAGELDARDDGAVQLAAAWTPAPPMDALDRCRGVESDRTTTYPRRRGDALAAVRALICGIEPALLVGLPRAVPLIPDPASCSDLEILVSAIAQSPELAVPIARVRVQLGAGRCTRAHIELEPCSPPRASWATRRCWRRGSSKPGSRNDLDRRSSPLPIRSCAPRRSRNARRARRSLMRIVPALVANSSANSVASRSCQ